MPSQRALVRERERSRARNADFKAVARAAAAFAVAGQCASLERERREFARRKKADVRRMKKLCEAQRRRDKHDIRGRARDAVRAEFQRAQRKRERLMMSPGHLSRKRKRGMDAAAQRTAAKRRR